MEKRKSTVLRQLINRGDFLLRPLVAIPLQAQMAEAAGFEVIGISGAYTAAHVLGLPDAGLITMTEMVENAQRICNAVNIPVMADGDTGFGNAINVRRTVRSMIQAGAAGMFIEDQVAPKRCGFVKGKEIVSLEEAVGKFKAAVDARNGLDEDFVIMARTDARTAVGGSLEEAIKRAKAYEDIKGVDIIYIEAMQSREEIKQIRSAISCPLACSHWGISPPLTMDEMKELGLCMTLGVMFFEAGFIAWWDMLVALKEQGVEFWYEWRTKVKDHPASWNKIFDLVGFPQVREWEEKYLPGDQSRRYADSGGLYEPH